MYTTASPPPPTPRLLSGFPGFVFVFLHRSESSYTGLSPRPGFGWSHILWRQSDVVLWRLGIFFVKIIQRANVRDNPNVCESWWCERSPWEFSCQLHILWIMSQLAIMPTQQGELWMKWADGHVSCLLHVWSRLCHSSGCRGECAWRWHSLALLIVNKGQTETIRRRPLSVYMDRLHMVLLWNERKWFKVLNLCANLGIKCQKKIFFFFGKYLSVNDSVFA